MLRLLGPVEVVRGDVPISLGGPKERALLAVLGASANHVVSEDTVIEALWGDSPPRTAARTLQSYLSRLRRALSEVVDISVQSRPGGYVLEAGPGALDVSVVQRLIKAGRDAVAAGDPAAAGSCFSQALMEWRGRPLGEFANEPWALAESTRLSELRLEVLAERIDTDLACGRHSALVAELESLSARHPLRERFWAQRMLALYRSGRQAEALRVYQELRRHLRDELGIDPSRDLQGLEQKMLTQDSELDLLAAGPAGSSGLPSGVVTFLLTDIVSSTRLWDAHPTEMAQALARHDAMIRTAVNTAGGVFLKARGEGDSTFSVFARATAAVAAARTARLALAAEAWPLPTPIRIRMALHTGEALERDGDYYGPAVNRVARLRDLAEGDQVLVSQSTATVVMDHLPGDCHLEELGRHELKDLARPEVLYRLDTATPLTPEPDRPEGERVALPARLGAPPFTGFHGRTAELDILAQRRKEAAAGEPRVVLIAGEPGIGKTALAAEATRAAFAAGSTVLYGRCDEDVGLPYQPWAEAIRYLLDHAPPEMLEPVGSRRLAELKRFMFSESGAQVSPADTGIGDPEAERYRLFGAVVSALAAAGARRPVTVVLDDLQWADKPTLMLLRHLFATAEPIPVLVIGTYRSTELSAGHVLADALAALRQEEGVERILLGGLADDELIALVEAASGQRLEGTELALVQAVYRETDGNPFYAWEIMLHLTETGAVALSDDGRWLVQGSLEEAGLPDSVREIIGRRVERLGPRMKPVLATASVIGRDFDTDVLAAALGVPLEDVLDVLERAEVAQLVTSMSQGRFSFSHALVAHTLYADLTPARRAQTHRQVAQALEALGVASRRVTELARHWAAAAATVEVAKAIDYARRAGEQALGALAPDEALRWFSQAVALLEQQTEADEHIRCELLLGLGDAQRQAGDALFRDTLLQAADLAERIGDDECLVRAALLNTRGGAVSGQIDAGRLSVLQKAVAVAGEGDTSAKALLLANLAVELSFAGDFPRRKAFADEAVAMARRIGDPTTLVRVISPVMSAIWVPDTAEERRALYREASELAESLNDSGVSFWVAHHGLPVALEACDTEEADRCLSVMTATAEELGQPTLRWMARWARSTRTLLAGDVAQAERLANEALELGIRSGQPDALTIYGAQLVCIRLHQDRAGELVDLVSQVAAESEHLVAVRPILARTLVAAGRGDEVSVDASEFSLHPYDASWALSMAFWAEVVSALGLVDAASSLYQLLLPHADHVANTHAACEGPIAHHLGILATVVGRYDEADRHFARAEARHQQVRALFHLARTYLEWGRMLVSRNRSGDRERGTELLQQALTIARESGYSGIEHVAADALASPPRIALPSVLGVATQRSFVGRADELIALQSAMAKAVLGERQVVLVAGEAGIGKSTLASEFAQGAYAEGATVLFGRCYEETLVPYQPFVEALRHYVLDCPRRVLEAQVGRGGAEIVRLLPEIRERLPEASRLDPPEAGGERYRLFEAVNALLAAASKASPVVLVLEDLHWADPGSVLLLQHLFRQPDPAALLVVGTYRDVDISSSHPLADALAEFRRARSGARIHLGGLTAQDVAGLLSDQAGREIDADVLELAGQLWSRTGGNPLFVEEVIRHLSETGMIQRSGGRWTTHLSTDDMGIPEGVKEVIGRRLARLSDPTRRCLAIASVAGGEFDLAVLDHVAAVDGDELVDAIEEADRAGLVTEVPKVFGRYAFAHALLRETLYAELSTVRRVRLHIRVGEVLEQIHADEPDPYFAELAHHFFEGAQAGAAAKAVHYARRAGDHAMTHLAYEEAAGHYDRALQALELEATPDEAIRCELLLASGESRRHAGDTVSARATFRSAAEIARGLHDAGLLAKAALGYGMGAGGLTRAARSDEDLIVLLDEALERIGGEAGALRVRLMARLTEELYYTPEAGRRAVLGHEAVEMSEQLGDPSVMLVALYAREYSRVGPDAPLDDRLDSSATLVRLAEELGDRETAYQAHLLRELVLMEAGDFAPAEEELEAAAGLASALKIPSLQAWATAARARRAWLAGRFAEADALNEKAMGQAVTEGGDPEVAMLVIGGQAMAQQQFRVNVGQYVPFLREAAGQYPQHTIIRCMAAYACMESGLLEEASAEFEVVAANDFQDLPHNSSWFDSIWSLARCCAGLNDARRAEILYDMLLPHQSRWLADWASISFGPVATVLGILATCLRRFDAAVDHFETAMAKAAAVPSPPWLADAQHQCAAMLALRRQPGDIEQARRLVDEALVAADVLGMPDLEGKLRALRESL